MGFAGLYMTVGEAFSGKPDIAIGEIRKGC
jgi:hypothetical protein